MKAVPNKLNLPQVGKPPALTAEELKALKKAKDALLKSKTLVTK